MFGTHIHIGASLRPSKWAAVIIAGGHLHEVSGDAEGADLDRAKLMALYNALAMLQGRHRVKVLTDSQYIANGINKWVALWRSNGMAGILNADLWALIDLIAATHLVYAELVTNYGETEYGRRAYELAGGPV